MRTAALPAASIDPIQHKEIEWAAQASIAKYLVVGVAMAQTMALRSRTTKSSLRRYLEEIKRFPMLEPQEEFMLAKRWREHGDREAANRLVTSHLRLAAKIAMGYRGYGFPISEVISEGNVGLMQGVKRFDPDRGFRLATYAMWWIRAAIQEIHPALVVVGEDGHHGQPEEAVFQSAQSEEPNRGFAGR